MYDLLEERALNRGFAALALDVQADRTGARRFYETNGLVKTIIHR